MRAAQAGDRDALDDLVRGHLPLLYNVIGRALNGHADVDDLVQDTMVRVVRGLPALRDPARFRSWAVAIAYRQVQRHMKVRTAARQRVHDMPLDPPDPGADFSERTVTELMLTGQRRELAEAARWLDDPDRRLLALWWQEAAGTLTRSDLAAVLGVTAAHAAVRIQRMRTRLESARAVVRALRTHPQCDALRAGWTGEVDPLWRKRFIRHVRSCAECGRASGGLVAPEKLLPGLGVVPLPASLSGFEAGGSTAGSSALGFLQHKVAALAAAALVAGGGFTYAVHETPWTSDGAAPGVLASAPAYGSPSGAPGSVAPVAGAPVPGGLATADLYIAPNGSDDGDGSLDRPFATLGKAALTVRPGQSIAMRGGVYRPTQGVVINVSGEPGNRITLSNYRDERPVIDAAGVPADKYAVTHRGSYWTVRGLEFMNSRSHAYVCVSCRGNVFQRLSMHDNERSGLQLRDPGTVDNQVLDSDFYNNYDPDDRGRAGIGVGIKFGDGTGNVIRGCRAFDNAASGFDVGYFADAVTLENNWSYGNGVNRWNAGVWEPQTYGFLLGGGEPAPPAAAHVLRNNAAWNNVGDGFAAFGNPGALVLRNNTSYRNSGTGFAMEDGGPAVLEANASVADATAMSGAGPRSNRNSWTEGGWTDAMFRSTDPATATGPRRPDGRLPVTEFLAGRTDIGAAMG